MAEHRDANLAEKDAKNARWPNMYGDLNPLPDVQKDMVATAVSRPIQWIDFRLHSIKLDN